MKKTYYFWWLMVGFVGLNILAIATVATPQSDPLDLVYSNGFEDPRPSCEFDTDPLNQPEFYEQRLVDWGYAFFDQEFPNISNGGLSPVGSFTFRNRNTNFYDKGDSMQGRYITIPFSTQGQHKIKWFRAQSLGSREYNARQADAVFVTVSPCPGDFRLATTALYDDVYPECQSYGPNHGGIFFGLGSACPVTDGYINIIFNNPFLGLPHSETTCESDNAPFCDANFGN